MQCNDKTPIIYHIQNNKIVCISGVNVQHLQILLQSPLKDLGFAQTAGEIAEKGFLLSCRILSCEH